MQRAAIARALQNGPSILLADEPTGNLDHANATAIFELFKKIRDENGTTVVVVTHDMQLASYADRAIHMADGQIVSGQVEKQSLLNATPEHDDNGTIAQEGARKELVL